MCGITGKIYFSNRTVEERDIARMNATIAHRGPDGTDIYLSPHRHVGLGHNRLAIIDLSSAGRQPMRYLNRYVITFNGEIYNYALLRQRLERDGYRFRSQTDTEVILALYDRYGVDCLQHLRGMFAFAIYDSKQQTLFCARDRLGKKPFKYFYNDQVFIFASELKAILTQSDYRKEPDFLAIHHYLTLQYCPAPLTGFKGIHKLEPAHYLWVDIARHSVEKKRYWQLDYSQPEQRPEAEWQQMILAKLSEAVKLRLIADVPLGAFLSGGVDSSAIVALMSQASSKPIKTFSIGFAERAFSELPYAKEIAKRFRTDHTEFLVRPSAIDTLPSLIRSYEEPYADSSALPTYYLSKLARQHVTVALTGDGGDENFAGYSRYNIQKFALWCDRWGISTLPGLGKMSGVLARHFRSTFFHRLHRFASTLPTDFQTRYVNYICYFSNPMKMRLYNDAFSDRVHQDTYHLLAEKFREAATPNPLDQTLYTDVTTYLPDDLLVKVDIASMAVSLEARSPFLDHEFMELTARIPFDLKLRQWRSNKYILKKALQGLLPPQSMNRPKQGFMLPIEAWFRGDLKKYTHSVLLAEKPTLTQEIFDQAEIRQLLATHETTRINLAPPIWALLTLELWYQEYFID